MITWRYGGPVKAKTSYRFEHLELTLVGINKRGYIKLIDKTGTIYNTHKDDVKFILPPFTVPTRKLMKLMNIEESDYFEQIRSVKANKR